MPAPDPDPGYTVMPDLISLPCEILFCFVFNRACPVLDTGASRDKKEGQVFALELVKDQPVSEQPVSVFRSDGLRILVFDSRLPTVNSRLSFPAYSAVKQYSITKRPTGEISDFSYTLVESGG